MKKDRPTPRQRTALRDRSAVAAQRRSERERSTGLRDPAAWIRNLVTRRRKARRGVEPGDPEIRYEWLHQHHDAAGRGSRNRPYVNPMRDVKALRSGRLRSELRP